MFQHLFNSTDKFTWGICFTWNR